MNSAKFDLDMKQVLQENKRSKAHAKKVTEDRDAAYKQNAELTQLYLTTLDELNACGQSKSHALSIARELRSQNAALRIMLSKYVHAYLGLEDELTAEDLDLALATITPASPADGPEGTDKHVSERPWVPF